MTLGLAAAGCGGKAEWDTGATTTEDGQNGADGAASPDARAEVATGADAFAGSQPDANGTFDANATPTDASVAADVAEETWIAPLIR